MTRNLKSLLQWILEWLGWPSRSIRFQLLCVINAVGGVGLLLFVAADYRSGLNQRVASRRTALQEEAQLVLASVERFSSDPQAVQEFLDAACARVRTSNSLGHHIWARVGTATFQSNPHDQDARDGLAPLHAAATNVLGQSQPILVGTARSNHTEILVSVFTANVLSASRRELVWRAVQLLLLGILATAILDLMILRLVVRPIQRLVGTVRRIGRRELGARVEHGGSFEFAFLGDEINALSASLAHTERQRAAQLIKARRIQEKLQPTPVDIAGWSVFGYTRPAEDVGGDFLDYRLLGQNRLIVCVGDVAGHGIPAAIAAAMLKMLYGVAVDRSQDPARILGVINQTFTATSLAEDFASMVVVVIDLDSGRLSYASAGHETGYVIGSDGCLKPLASTGLPLGIDAQASWSISEQKLGPGDRLVLLTDGWPEALRRDGMILGRDAFVQALQGSRRGAAGTLPQSLLSSAIEGGANHPDDLTLVVIDRQPADLTDKENRTCNQTSTLSFV